MDMKILHDEADKARAEAKSLRQLAGRKTQSAEGLDDNGAQDKAGVVRDEAQGLERSADAHEQQAAELEVMIEAAHKRVEALNSEEQAVRKEYEGKLKAIDDERHQLLGE